MMRVQRRDGWLTAQLDDELVMLDAEAGRYVGLSAMGARIWALLEETDQLAALCARLEAEFEVSPERCRAEVTAFLQELAGQGAVTLS